MFTSWRYPGRKACRAVSLGQEEAFLENQANAGRRRLQQIYERYKVIKTNKGKVNIPITNLMRGTFRAISVLVGHPFRTGRETAVKKNKLPENCSRGSRA